MAFREIKPVLCHRNDLNTGVGMLGGFLLSVLGRGISASVHNCLVRTRKLLVTFSTMVACFNSIFWHRKQ